MHLFKALEDVFLSARCLIMGSNKEKVTITIN